MTIKMTARREALLYNEISLLLKQLADAWDPPAGKTAEVNNTLLKEADRLSRILDDHEVTL